MKGKYIVGGITGTVSIAMLIIAMRNYNSNEVDKINTKWALRFEVFQSEYHKRFTELENRIKGLEKKVKSSEAENEVLKSENSIHKEEIRVKDLEIETLWQQFEQKVINEEQTERPLVSYW